MFSGQAVGSAGLFSNPAGLPDWAKRGRLPRRPNAARSVFQARGYRDRRRLGARRAKCKENGSCQRPWSEALGSPHLPGAWTAWTTVLAQKTKRPNARRPRTGRGLGGRGRERARSFARAWVGHEVRVAEGGGVGKRILEVRFEILVGRLSARLQSFAGSVHLLNPADQTVPIRASSLPTILW